MEEFNKIYYKIMTLRRILAEGYLKTYEIKKYYHINFTNKDTAIIAKYCKIEIEDVLTRHYCDIPVTCIDAEVTYIERNPHEMVNSQSC